MKATPHPADTTPHPADIATGPADVTTGPADVPVRPTATATTPHIAEADLVLAEIAGLLARIMEDEYGLDDVEIGMATTFNRDLELESIDLVTLSGLLEERYGGRVNFAEFLAGMEFDEIIELTVGRLVAYVVTSLKAAEAS